MKTLIVAAALFQPAAPDNVPQLYSFDDVYRLTVTGAAMADFPDAAGPVRVAVSASAAAPAAEFTFSVRQLPSPDRSLLLLSGLAAGLWVARRRLGAIL
jgi:hypothetical protein